MAPDGSWLKKWQNWNSYPGLSSCPACTLSTVSAPIWLNPGYCCCFAFLLLWLWWSIPLRNLEENPMKTGQEAVMSGILDVIPKVVPLCRKNGPPLQVELDYWEISLSSPSDLKVIIHGLPALPEVSWVPLGGPWKPQIPCMVVFQRLSGKPGSPTEGCPPSQCWVVDCQPFSAEVNYRPLFPLAVLWPRSTIKTVCAQIYSRELCIHSKSRAVLPVTTLWGFEILGAPEPQRWWEYIRFNSTKAKTFPELEIAQLWATGFL